MATQQSELSKFSFPLLPKKGKVRASDQEKGYRVEPLDKLPSFLLPSVSQKYHKQPPTLHFGWLVDDAVLLRLCKERGIGPPPLDRESIKDELEDLEFKDGDFDTPEEPDEFHMTQAFMRRCKELQLNNFPDLAPVFDSSTKRTALVVSLLTNYDVGTIFIDKSDRDKLVHEFGLEGQPKWYLDYMEWHWK